MNDREALTAALAVYEGELGKSRVLTAARKYLAQLPEKCGTCINKAVPGFVALGQTCPTCHGSGKVYPAELVERVKAALRSVWPVDPAWWPEDRHAVAVLDAALNGETL